jgi:hypothetical protein
MVEFASSILRPTIARGGGLPAGGLTIAFVAAASAVHATGIAPQIMRGSPIQFIPVPATLPLAVLVDRLEAIQPRALYGYASMLARLAVERRAGRLRIAPATIVSTSETLLEEQRAVIIAAFGASLVNTFATSEGLVGVSEPDHATLTFASDLCIVELVDEADRPVPVGVRSAKSSSRISQSRPATHSVRARGQLHSRPEAGDSGHLRAHRRGACGRHSALWRDEHPSAYHSRGHGEDSRGDGLPSPSDSSGNRARRPRRRPSRSHQSV